MPSSSFYNGLRIFTSVAFLTLIIITVPIAFDVGGRDCGLAFSLSLAAYYILLSILRLSVSTRRSRFAWVVYLAGALQYIIVPALLIASLDRFSGEDGQQQQQAVVAESTTDRIKRALGYRVDEHVLPVGGLHPSLVDRLTIVPWYSFLTIFSPIFQLVEGFCTLLVIQAVGQISKWLVNTKKSDTWMVSSLFGNLMRCCLGNSLLCNTLKRASGWLYCVWLDYAVGHIRHDNFVGGILLMADLQFSSNW